MKEKSIDKSQIAFIKNTLCSDVFFNNTNFTFIDIAIEKSKLLNDRYVFKLNNSAINRKINVSILKRRDEDNYSLSVYLFNAHNEYLSVKDYIKKKNIFQEDDHFHLNFYHGSFEEKFQRFLDFIHHVLEKNMHDIFIGKAWETIPFDWGEYK